MPSSSDEPLLRPNQHRFVLRCDDAMSDQIWRMYKQAEASFWTVEEVDLFHDREDWAKLNPDEKHYIKHVLAFFAASDGIVNENLAQRFMSEVQVPAARAFYGFQIAIENIHCVAKETLILTRSGYQRIDQLVDQTVEVWNGRVFSSVVVRETSPLAPLVEVSLSDGRHLWCTYGHKWLVQGPTGIERVKTQDLQIGSVIPPTEYPRIQDGEEIPVPLIHGLSSVSWLRQVDANHLEEARLQYNLHPPLTGSISARLAWLNSYIAIAGRSDSKSDLILEGDKSTLRDVQRLLETLGVGSSWLDQVLHVNRTWLESGIPQATEPVTVVRIGTRVRMEPTYCFNEPLDHTGVFNGIRTGQSEMYTSLIETLITDRQEQQHLLRAIETLPTVKAKAEWALRWIENPNAPFAERLIAFACVEGIFFSSSFAAINWLKKRGLMPGLTFSNDLISRDEGLHTDFACLLYKFLLYTRCEAARVNLIVGQAVEIEKSFVREALPVRLIGLNSDLMCTYIEFVADRLLYSLGYDKFYHVSNPLSFMDIQSLRTKQNFFEGRVSDYAKAHVGKDDRRVLQLDCDF